MGTKKITFPFVMFILSLLMFLSWCVARFNMYRNFEKIDGYLYNYVRASTVEAAKENLDKAIAGLKERNITEGNTGIFWNRPSDDVGLWYKTYWKPENS